jgi:hypothetical protein
VPRAGLIGWGLTLNIQGFGGGGTWRYPLSYPTPYEPCRVPNDRGHRPRLPGRATSNPKFPHVVRQGRRSAYLLVTVRGPGVPAPRGL